MKIQFSVNPEDMAGFADVLAENGLSNSITGTTDEGNIMIDVHLSSEDRDTIQELEELSVNDDD